MEKEIREPPKELNAKSVVYWSNSFKDLVVLEETGVFKTSAIRAKGRLFVEKGCISYDKAKKCYLCLPIKGYNHSTYEMRNNEAFKSRFDCTCQFHSKVVSKNPQLMCSHVLALKLQLKIWNWEKQKQINTSASLLSDG